MRVIARTSMVLAVAVLGSFSVATPGHAAELGGSCPTTRPVDLASLADSTIASATPMGGIMVESATIGSVDEAAEAQRRAEEETLFRHLVEQRAALAAGKPVDARLDAARTARLATDESVPLKVGESVELARAFDFATIAIHPVTGSQVAPAGQAAQGADGGVTWETAVVSKGASALRLELRDFDLAPGVELFVYNEAGQVRGPYRGRGPDDNGEFWTASVFGDRVRLQLHADDAAALAASRFVLGAAMHMGPRFRVADAIAASYLPGPTADGNFCGVTVPDCTINGVCAIDTNPGLTAASNAVAQINFVKGGSGYICSGALINPTGSLRTPYFLTANHCFNTQASASSLEAHFRFRTQACSTSCTMATMLEANGSTLMATGAAPSRGDYTLVRLNSVPGGLTLLGWNSGRPAEASHLIHLGHPGGSPLAYSVRRVRHATSPLPNCSALPRPTFLYSGLSSSASDAQGATAGGSSGGPALLLAAGGGSSYIVGQLYGGCSFEDADRCNANEYATVDGSLEKSFPYLRPFIYERIFSNGFN